MAPHSDCWEKYLISNRFYILPSSLHSGSYGKPFVHLIKQTRFVCKKPGCLPKKPGFLPKKLGLFPLNGNKPGFLETNRVCFKKLGLFERNSVCLNKLVFLQTN